MRGVFIHAVVYAVVNAFLLGVWLVVTGSSEELRVIGEDPIQGLKDGFWPGYVAAGWALALALHIGIWLVSVPFQGSSRRQREEKAHAREVRHAQRHELPPPPPPPVPRPGQQITREAARVAIDLVDSLGKRVAAGRAPKPPTPSGRQWVAVMFTDIAGSTDLTETLGDDSWIEILGSHRSMVRACLSDHDGAEVGTQGDGFLVRFDSPDAAVACATAIQRRIHDGRIAGAFMPEVRIGVHAGEAVAGDGDLVGRVINLASRVTGAAEPGEILVTEPVADALSPGVRLVDRGLKPLKGIAQPRHLLAVRWQDDADETIVLDDAAATD